MSEITLFADKFHIEFLAGYLVNSASELQSRLIKVRSSNEEGRLVEDMSLALLAYMF